MAAGPKRRKAGSAQALAALDPRTRRRLAFVGAALLAIVVLFAACGGCGRRASGPADKARTSAGEGAAPKKGAPDAGDLRDPLLWTNAKEGEVEDLAELAVHEGAAGLVEAASEPQLRPTAIRAMAYARGWAQLPFLATVASGKDDEEARLALESVVELAARPRTSEDPEDVEELRQGCEALGSLARDTARPRARRVAAVRALRMMPCPEMELPTDVDAR
jgi:hypothetical protein